MSSALHVMVEMVQRHLTATGRWDEFEHQGKFTTTRISLAELSTTLMDVAKKGEAGYITRLLADPRSIYLQNERFGLATLRWAVSKGHKEALVALLTVGDATLKKADDDGNLLVHYCIQDTHHSCLQMLISRGVGTLKRNNSGKTVWHLAASHGSTRILELLLQSEDTAVALQMTTPDGRRSLEESLYHGHAQAALMLIRGGLPPEHSLTNGLPIAHLAVRCNFKDLFVAMQQIGLDIDRSAPDGSTPLHHLEPTTSLNFASYLKTLYSVRKLRQDGLTAVEVLLLSCSADSQSDSERLIQELLPDDHLVSSGKRHIWEFFASRIVPDYKTWDMGVTLKKSPPCEARALIAAGAVSSYERFRGQSACLPLFQAREETFVELGIPGTYYAIIEAVVGATGMLETMQQCPAAIQFLKKVIRDSPIPYNNIDNNIELLGLLLNKVRVDPTVREKGQSALESLVSGPRFVGLKVFETIISSMEPGRLNDLLPTGRGLLDYIILDPPMKTVRLKLARCLLDKGADPNIVCTEKYSRRPAIVAASKARSLPMMRLLLEYGANPLSKDSNGWDLAKYAAHHDDLDALKLLETDRTGAIYDWRATCSIFSQTPVGAVLINGCNLLHVAAFSGSTSVIKHLWQKGVLGDPNVKTVHLLTPLHLAAMNGKSKTIEILVKDFGADVFARAYDGQLPFDLSVTCGRPKATATLLRLTAGSVIYLELSICRGMLDLCKRIISQGCSVERAMASCGGCTPLFVAVRAGRVNIARWLLQSGARIFDLECPVHTGDSSSILELAVLYLPTAHEFLQDILSKLLEQRRSICVPELLNAARTAVSRKHLPVLSGILSHLREHAAQYK